MSVGMDHQDFDGESVRAKYQEERDKRLVPGNGDIHDLRHDPFFARFRDDPFTPVTPRERIVDDVEVAIVGGGLAGTLTGVHLRKSGLQRIRIIDVAGGIGGTWYWNRYPGVSCDVESYIYLPMLEEFGYIPTAKYVSGDEIREHLETIAARYDLVREALFHTEVTKSAWDDAGGRWVVHTNRGDTIRAQYLVMAVGHLNLMKIPVIAGMEYFQGRAFHAARWDFGYTGGTPDGHLSGLADKVVAVIGTGASAVQCLPAVGASAQRTYVFQRTPIVVGVRNNRPTDEEFMKGLRPGWQWERMLNFQDAMDGVAGSDLVDDGWTHHWAPLVRARVRGMSPEERVRNIEALDFSIMEEHRRRIDEVVEDPETARALKPYYRYLCRRPTWHDEYLDTFNLPTVTLVDCPAGIERITEHGVVVAGREYEVDCIIYATGFEAEQTPLPRRVGHEVVGRGGETLAEKWGDRAQTLNGLFTHGFPNLFLMPAPFQQAANSINFALISTVAAQNIAAIVESLGKQDVHVFEVAEEAEADWVNGIIESSGDWATALSACTPSRLNYYGDVSRFRPENSNYGGGAGDFVGAGGGNFERYCNALAAWQETLARGEPCGLVLERRQPSDAAALCK